MFGERLTVELRPFHEVGLAVIVGDEGDAPRGPLGTGVADHWTDSRMAAVAAAFDNRPMSSARVRRRGTLHRVAAAAARLPEAPGTTQSRRRSDARLGLGDPHLGCSRRVRGPG